MIIPHFSFNAQYHHKYFNWAKKKATVQFFHSPPLHKRAVHDHKLRTSHTAIEEDLK